MKKVRVRFAPSPTGELHVGGVRTALFNWLYAKKLNGIFVLRIEDTDKARSSEEMTRQILDGMKWLGLEWDEGPHFQSEGVQKHYELAEKLLKEGKAYYDFIGADELSEMRKQSQKAGKPFKYDRRGMEPDLEKAMKRIEDGEQAAVRFKIPQGETSYHDLVHGDVTFNNDKIDDFVILRSDNSPTYMLSVVADDISMGITHVIRGDDHLANTPKQILLYRAIGAETPQFAHLPLILGPDKKKLSKRHGGNTLKDYMEEGFLPIAVVNFLALLGWNPGDDREVLSKDDLIEAFSFEGIGNSAAVFDISKLEWINSQWINRIDFDQLLPEIKREMQREGTWADELEGSKRPWFKKVVDLLKERSRKTADIARDGTFFFRNPDNYDEKAVKRFCKAAEITMWVRTLAKGLNELTAWQADAIEERLRELAESLDVGAGKLIHPLRIGSTGMGVTPDVFQIAEILGKETVYKRLLIFADYLQENPAGDS